MPTTTIASTVRAVTAAVLLVLLVAVAGAAPVAADDVVAATDGDVEVEFFWGEGCPYCEQQKVFLDALEAAHPDIVVNRYEVWNDADNQQLMRDALAPFGIEPTGVPATVLDDQYWIGFNEQIGSEIAAAVEARSTVTVSDDVSTGPEPDDGVEADAAQEQQAAVEGSDGGTGSGANVLIGLGVAVAVAIALGGVMVVRQRRAAAAKPQRRR